MNYWFIAGFAAVSLTILLNRQTTENAIQMHILMELIDETINASKHWSITVTGSIVNRQWGRLAKSGQAGWSQSSEVEFADAGQARKFASAAVRKKVKKGYRVKRQQGEVV